MQLIIANEVRLYYYFYLTQFKKKNNKNDGLYLQSKSLKSIYIYVIATGNV